MTREVQQHRAEHNYAPDTCISNVAAAMWRNVDQRRFQTCLAELGPDAMEFWTPSVTDREREYLEHPFTGHFLSTPLGGRPGSDRRPA